MSAAQDFDPYDPQTRSSARRILDAVRALPRQNDMLPRQNDMLPLEQLHHRDRATWSADLKAALVALEGLPKFAEALQMVIESPEMVPQSDETA